MSKDLKTENKELNKKLKIAVKALKKIRNIDWGTDHCDGKNIIADEALSKLEKEKSNG